MDEDASDENDWLNDDFEEDDDDEDGENDEDRVDEGNIKSSCEVEKHSSDRNDGDSHQEEDMALPIDPPQHVVDRANKASKRKGDDKRPDKLKQKNNDYGESGGGSLLADCSVARQEKTPFHQTSAFDISRGITGVSEESPGNVDNPSGGISCLGSESLKQHSGTRDNLSNSQQLGLLSDDTPHGLRGPDGDAQGSGSDVSTFQTQRTIPPVYKDETLIYDRQENVQIPWKGAVSRPSPNSFLQPGAQSSFSQSPGESSRNSGGSTINLVGNTGVHINRVSRSYDPLKPIQEQSQSRCERDLNEKVFVKTEKIKECEKTLKTWGVLLLTGGPGEGKTTAGLHLLKLMSESDSRRPLIFTDPVQWDHISSSTHNNNRYVILIDDAFGLTNLVEDLRTRWEQKFPMMIPLIEAGTVCVIFSLRTNIYLQNEKQFRAFELFSKCKPVSFSTDDLSEKERFAMLDLHLEYNRKGSLSDDEKREIIWCKELVAFPFCCYLFTSALKGQGYNFFNRSFKYLAEVITEKRQNDSEGFFILLLVMFYDNLLPKTVFDVFTQSREDKEIIETLSQVCSFRLSLGSLLKSAESMCLTFLVFDTDKCFSFKHNSIRDAVFLEFCKDHLSKGLQMCSSRTLLEYVTTDRGSCQDIAVVVSESDFDKLAARLVKEILSPSGSLIFTHQAFKDLSFLKYLFHFLNADMRREIALFNREIQNCGVHQYLTDTTVTYLMNKCLNQSTPQHTFHLQYVKMLSIASIPACFVLNGADRIAVHLLKQMKQYRTNFSRHANISLACSFYMNNSDLTNELIELGAEITFECFKAVCIAPSINENLVELAAGILSEAHADSLWNLLTLSLESGGFECIKQIIPFMAEIGRFLQLEEFCKRLLIVCHNTKPSWISVPHEDTMLLKTLELLHNHGVNCSSDMFVLLAAGCCDLRILKYLVKSDGNVHCRSETGQSLLHLAALYGTEDTVMYLIEQEVDRNAIDKDGYTPFQRAAQSCTESYEKILLLADENSKLKLISGESVLDIAIKKGDIESVEYICSHFASINGYLSQALFVAVEELAKILSNSESYADEMLKEKWIQNRNHILQRLIKSKIPLHYLGDHMISSLRCLAERGKEDIFGAVVELFDMPKCKTHTLFQLLKIAYRYKQAYYSRLFAKHNRRAVQLVLSYACELGDTAIVECLVQAGAKVNVKDDRGWTPLHYACTQGDTALVQGLVKKGGGVNVEDKDGLTPLHYACKYCDIAMLKCLVKGGAGVNVKDKDVLTPLHYACKHGDTTLVEYLVNKDAEVNVKDKDRLTPLHYACKRGDAAMVEYLVNKDAEVNVKDKDGLTPLHCACKRGGAAMVEYLVNKDAEVNVKDKDVLTPLHCACKRGDAAMVEYLVNKDAEVNVKDKDGLTPLHYACKHGDTAMVENLVKEGEELNVKDKDGLTPLHYACRHGDTAMVECLVKEGAVVNVKDKDGLTPLHCACKHGDAAMVEYLVNKDAEVNVKDKDRLTPLHYACKHGDTVMVECFVKKGAEVNVKDQDGLTPLHYACRHGETAMVEYLVKEGAVVNVKDKDGLTPLHYACRHGDTAMVQCLVKEGAVVNVKDKDVLTPLHCACKHGDTAMVEYLVNKDAEVNVKDKDRLTPLHCACKHGDTVMVECFVKKGAEVNVKDQDGWTPLHYACKHGDTTLVECLVKEGADVNVEDKVGLTPLHCACRHGDTSMVECLVNKNADVNVMDQDGWTPLHYACKHGDTTLVECLVKEGADVNVEDKVGLTPLHCACRHGDTSMVECLVNKNADVNVMDEDGWTPLHYAYRHSDTAKIACLVQAGAVMTIKDKYVLDVLSREVQRKTL